MERSEGYGNGNSDSGLAAETAYAGSGQDYVFDYEAWGRGDSVDPSGGGSAFDPQLAFGLLTGAAVAWLVTWLLKRYAFYGEGFDTIFVFAAAIISYALASQIGGNGYLSVYLTSIILGNQDLKNQKALVGFFDAFTGMMQMLLFSYWTSGVSLADAVDRTFRRSQSHCF